MLVYGVITTKLALTWPFHARVSDPFLTGHLTLGLAW